MRASTKKDDSLPRGTAYVTPDGVIGVVGDTDEPVRALASANIDALYALQAAIRVESTHR